MNRIASAFVIAAVLCSCDAVRTVPSVVIPTDADHVLCLYLCGDGLLEAHHAELVNRLEETASVAGPGGTQVLALVDGPDDAHLYRIIHDPAGSPDHTSLALQTWDSSRPMGDPAELDAFLQTARNEFADAELSLAVSGTGRGYSGVCADSAPHSDFMETGELAQALARHRVTTLVLDSSFSASVEIAYELAVRAPLISTLVAVQGHQPDRGLPFDDALDRLTTLPLESFPDVLTAVASDLGYPLPAVIDLARVPQVVYALDALARDLSETEAQTDPESLRRFLFYDLQDFYATPGDLSLSILDLATSVEREYPEAATRAAGLAGAVGEAGPLTVHLIPLLSDGAAAPTHRPDYIRGGGSQSPISFVSECSWAPGIADANGLLFALFYE